MSKALFDKVKPIIDRVKAKEDFKEAVPKLEALFDDPEIDTSSNDYFRLADLLLNAYRALSHDGESDSKGHLLRQREIHERILANPYSFLFPHTRIDSEFEIGHIDLLLKGVKRRKLQEDEEAEVEVEGDA